MEEDNENATTGEGTSIVEEQKKAADKGGVPAFTEAQLARKVKCRTSEGEIIEVPWHLMMQSKTFMNMWETLEIEEEFDQQQKEENAEPFIFPLENITNVCFRKIVEWMDQHRGLSIRDDQITSKGINFITDWVRNFFDVDCKMFKEYFLAADFLKLNSLINSCAEEFARQMLEKKPEEVSEMFTLFFPKPAANTESSSRTTQLMEMMFI